MKIFQIQIEYYNFEGLYSEIKSIFLSEFNNFHDEDNCHKICTALKAKYAEHESSFYDNCKKSIHYLNHLENKYEATIKTAQGSLYLYCWLYDKELYKQIYNNKQINIYKELIQEFGNKVHLSNMYTVYRIYLKDGINDKIIKLYELYYKFDKFMNRQNCGDNHCKCAEDCAGFYNNYMREHCGITYDIHFCKELQNFANMYNAFFEKNNKCEGKEMKLLLTENRHIRVILTPILIIAIVSFITFFLFKVTNKFNLNK
ncbi:hypothetical protein PVBG_05458 [Plasmodium vivax Brazil I]|uniref:Variable surface protein n=1 Tax=Plasmodium vivax (strain Brazil I) TaxID=1033975 RepID=A0A0J9ST28_PLAV1|nr:hypothetical protein PVBG_05458 [Plasmodium vivax Brazil I]